MNRRHIHIVCLALLLFLPYIAFAQGSTTPITYQYWLDNNTGEATTATGNDAGDGLGINLDLDVGSLSPGVHYYNIRAAEDGRWGTVQRFIFSIPAIPDDVDPCYIAGYEYWMDNDYEHRVFTEVPDVDWEEHTTGVLPIDVSSLDPGVHYYNIRFWGTDEKWSTTQRYIFSIPAVASGTEPADLKNIEYWIDNDYANRIRTTASGSQTTTQGLDISEVDLSSLAPGVHYYNIRVQDEDGIWGTPQRFIFSIPAVASGAEPADLKNNEYWIDDDYANRIRTTASGSQTTTEGLDISEVDVSSLAPGVHYYNMRAQDEDGIWGTPQRFIFSIPAVASGAEPTDLKNIECWIDDDYANRVSKQITDDEYTTDDTFATIDMTDFAPGIHYYNMRAQDENGIWGAPQRFIFSIPAPQQPTVDKDITGYSYSFNSGTPTNVTFASPVDEFEQALSFNVPSPGTLMVVDDSCKFEFNATNSNVKMRRYTPMSFTLMFIDENNTHSAPLVEEFVVVDSLTQDVAPITSPGTYTIESHADGGFTAMSFAVSTSTKLALRSNGGCNMRLYNSEGELQNTYGADAMQEGVSKTYAAGTYYAIFFGNTADIKFGFSPGDDTGMNALRPSLSYDETTQIITISGTIDGASYYYTIDGTNPTIESTLYTGPFMVINNATIKAIASWGDMVVSNPRSYVVSTIKGDAGGDGTIDIADVTAIINFILGHPSSTFAENLADMNGDNVVDIFDAMLLLNYIINNITTNPSGARRMYSGVANEPTEQIMLAAEQEHIYVGIDQAERFTSFQFDLTLPSGTELSDVRFVSGANTHRLMFAPRGTNTYRVVGYSLKNELLPSADDKLIELQLSGAAKGDVIVRDILFVTPSEQKVWMAGKSISIATQIDEVEMDTEAKDIYNLNGQKLDNSRKQLDKGVYIINHKKVIIK